MKIRLALSLLAILCLASCATAYRSVSAGKFARIIDNGVQILDVRTAKEFSEGHIEGALLADVKMDNFLETALSKLSKEAPVAVYCRSGGAASQPATSSRKRASRYTTSRPGSQAGRKPACRW